MQLKPGDEQAFIWLNDANEPDIVTLSPSAKICAWMALNAHSDKGMEWPDDLALLVEVMQASIGGRLASVKIKLEEL